jgi:lysophospholipase L1-like esterase
VGALQTRTRLGQSPWTASFTGGVRVRWLLIATVLSLTLWTVFATLVVPPLIESAYHGDSWPLLNRLISGQDMHPVGAYLQEWKRVTIVGWLGCLGFWVAAWVLSSRVFVSRLPIFYRSAALLTLNTLLLFAGFEFVAKRALNIATVVVEPGDQVLAEGRARESVSYYASQDWAGQYWDEFRLARKQRYYPYVGWRRAPFAGKTIRVDQQGIRATPNSDCRPDSYKVFAFGGSTMWGTGSPDWGTIPAYLQAGLQKLRPGPVCVVNYGETAYVSTQSVILLLMQLQSGNVPDLVLFYDGPNNVYAAYQSGRAGVPQNLPQLVAKFEKGSPTAVEWLTSLASYSLVETLIGRLTPGRPRPEDRSSRHLATYATMGVDVATLSAAILQEYIGNYQVVTALAQKYGFASFFFVQPIVSMGRKPLTNEEQEIKQRLEMDEAVNKLCTSVYHQMELESTKLPALYSMVHLFDGYDSLLWIDEAHVTPRGNQLVAEEMLDVITAHGSAAASRPVARTRS